MPLPALILSAGMLALAKPPYFLVLGLFVASAVLERTAGRIRAACVAGAALLVGLAATRRQLRRQLPGGSPPR